MRVPQSSIRKSFWTYALFALSILLYVVVGCDQGPPKNSLAAQTQRGKAIFMEKCASCHNDEARVAASDSLGVEPKDLSRIVARRRGNEFPITEIARIIDGRKEVAAHGPRAMPVWGEVFEGEALNEQEIRGKLGELVAYLMSIQSN